MPFTSPDNIYYPDSSGSTSLWVHHQTQAQSVQAKFAAYETWNNWTLSWDTTAGGGFTSVGGSGFSQGHYMRIGSGSGALIHAEFRVELASGFAVDTGTFILMLPVTAYAFSGAVFHSTLGTWTARDDSVPNHWSGSLSLYQSSADRVSFGGAWDGTSPKKRIDSNDPIVWAAGDVLSGVLNYRAA